MNQIWKQVSRRLGFDGPQTTSALAQRLGISVSSVQRALRGRPDVLSLGRARQTRHAIRRPIEGVDCPIPLYRVGAQPILLGHLHPVEPDGFGYAPIHGAPVWTPDLPWFLYDLRPAGYLGRQVPKLHPTLPVPRDILLWSGDHVLRYLVQHGVDNVGDLVLGTGALLTLAKRGPLPFRAPNTFPTLAADALTWGPVGSSAGGEQAKFLCRTDLGDVLVKFSPPRDGALSIRRADLLISEHFALQALRTAGFPAAHSRLLVGERTFLEVQRFDRTDAGRIGQVMLTAVDAEFVGLGTDWVAVMRALHAQGRVSDLDLHQTYRRALFGRWIYNTDMHLGNLSLRLRGLELDGLCPTYDMLPMGYAPVAGEVVPRSFVPTIDDADGSLMREVHPVALGFWESVRDEPRISEGFRKIAAQNHVALLGLQPTIRWLP